MRLQSHPFLTLERGKQITFFYNGEAVEAYASETIAAALFASGILKTGESRVLHRARGVFCGNGTCCSCLMTVDGVPNVRVCITPCREGMVVESQSGEGGESK